MSRQGITFFIVVAGLTAGCVAIHPEVDSRAGEAVTAARHAQTLNPGGTRPPADAPGIDGRAAKEGMDRYVESFRAPPPTTNIINIGGSLGQDAQR